ncbi:MAG: alanine-zipper protein [Burkholderiaceae bacterium]
MINNHNRFLGLSMILSAVVLAAGCATTADVERVQGEAAAARKLAQEAKSAADQAGSTANAAAADARAAREAAAAAQRSADEAKAAAQEAKRAADEAKAATQALNEKLDRAFKQSQKK